MRFMNDYDIYRAGQIHERHHVAGRAVRILDAFCHHINGCSDGIGYWRPPLKAAQKLIAICEGRDEVTEAELRKALTPIKSFVTKHRAQGVTFNPMEVH